MRRMRRAKCHGAVNVSSERTQQLNFEVIGELRSELHKLEVRLWNQNRRDRAMSADMVYPRGNCEVKLVFPMRLANYLAMHTLGPARWIRISLSAWRLQQRRRRGASQPVLQKWSQWTWKRAFLLKPWGRWTGESIEAKTGSCKGHTKLGVYG